MPLTHWKVELRIRWTKHFVLRVLSVANADNDDGANSNKIAFAIKDIELLVTAVVLYEQKNIKKYWNSLAKDLKDPYIGINIKQKVKIKIQQMSINIFLIKRCGS